MRNNVFLYLGRENVTVRGNACKHRWQPLQTRVRLLPKNSPVRYRIAAWRVRTTKYCTKADGKPNVWKQNIHREDCR